MRLSAALLIACLALAGCGGGDEETGSDKGSASGSDTAVEGDAGDPMAGMTDEDLCIGQLQTWLTADAKVASKLADAGPDLSAADIEAAMADAAAEAEPLAQAEDEQLASLAAQVPKTNEQFAEAFGGDDSQAQGEALQASTDLKSQIIERCAALAS